MFLCAECHKSFGCDVAHWLTNTQDECGICGKRERLFECYHKAAREIDGFNAAMKGFVLEMRARFIENMHKGGWQEIDYAFAARRVLEEAGELTEALLAGKGRDWHLPVMREAVDVANFALFIHSRAGTEAHAARSREKMVDERLAGERK